MKEIFERRSIRKYKNQEVEAEKIKKLLEAAVAAPSAGNEQPWHFIVIKDKKRLNQLAEIHPYAKMLKEAPLAIAVCADLNKQKYDGFWVQDCSAATQNILLEAVSLDLGAVWIGCHPAEDREKAISEYLEAPENVKTLSLISVGYPAEEKGKVDRLSDEIIHQEKW
ncbi:nitroreductase [Halanaerobium saccharolyticum]|uniref:Nitroreductase n=1 Tax=Halanaerobium saccharolyticum TaxID=43595 RepID=A0A4R7Z9X2_9FIRM|nr:nitroreductase family protein [Halanaerobium saccharolyticum]RAK10494.1 nitroreductase [Halanaerobium saccharolyticum]TDW06749.1 nitroreductase [Halanaerobium saccharolyticum]TDX62384.1 nitroreductase [Halanaerobium saccharolyticum]